MCGITAIFNKCKIKSVEIKQLLKTIEHRGPDDTIYYKDTNAHIGFVRLGIMDPLDGNQPFYSKDNKIVGVVNGEIYNYKKLISDHGIETKTESDCEVLIHLYNLYGSNFMRDVKVDGMFSFIIYDTENNIIVTGRDFMGIIPFYIAFDVHGNIYFTSEMKNVNHCNNIQIYEPGVITIITNFDYVNRCHYNYYSKPWFNDSNYLPIGGSSELNMIFTRAVQSHIMSDVKFGVLLSGGLDSSLIASIVSNTNKNSKPITTFSIGLKGSPDLESALTVAKFLKTKHYNFEYTVEDGLDVMEEVIYHIETFDTTTIRASIPMYILARKIKALGFKMVLSGEGADEMFGGYLYFHKAPNQEEFKKETVSKMKKLYYYDNQRANKSMMAWGIEVRVPFQDRDMIDYVMDMDPVVKMCKDDLQKDRIQKHILRSAFDTPGFKYLPTDILWRQKEQFSDGVGYNWIKSLKTLADSRVSDCQISQASLIYPIMTPTTKEEFMYRTIYETKFSKPTLDTINFEKSVACSTQSALKWSALRNVACDPSGLCIDDIHLNDS